MPRLGRVYSFVLLLLALPLAGWADVSYTISGTLRRVDGTDPLTLDGRSITASATLSQTGSPTTNSGSSTLTVNNVTGINFTVTPGSGTPLNCTGSGGRVVLTDNVGAGTDSISIQNCTLPLNLGGLQADVAIPAGNMIMAVPHAFSSSLTGNVYVFFVVGGLTTYALDNGSISASGDPAPAITPSPSSWSPSAQEGASGTQNQTVTLSAPWPISYTTSDDAPWLSVTPSAGNTNTSLSLSVNPSGLAAGMHNGSVTVNTGQGQVSIPVNFNITPPPKSLTPNPTSFTFNHTIGLTPPTPQELLLDTTPASSTNVNVSVTSGGTWLSVSPNNGTTPGSFQVSVNPAGLPAGQLTGNIQVTASGVNNSPLNIPVTFNVTGSTLSVPNTPLTFNYTIGGSNPASQQVTVGGTSGIGFNTGASTSSGGNWLSVTPPSGTVSQNITISVNPSGLSAGTYNGTVTVTSLGASGSPATIPVSLVVSQPTLNVTPNPLSFNYQIGGSTPASQNLTITGANISSFSAVAAGGAWLSVSPGSGAVPGSATVSVNPSGLPPNTYNGTVTISATGANPVVVNVSLTVTPAPTISATPTELTFNYQIGGSVPLAQDLAIGGTAGLVYTLSDDQPWLNLSNGGGTTPGSVSVSVNPAGLSVGTHNATITVSSTGASNSPRTVAVTLHVTPQPVLDVSPGSLSFNYQIGASAPPGQALSIGGTGVSSFTAVAAGGAWLSVTPGSGPIPGLGVTVNVNPSGLTPATYNGTVTISAAGANPVIVPVTFTVTPQPTISTAPESLTFDYQLGGSVPPAQTLNINGSAPVAYTLAESSPWLELSSSGGTTPGSVSVSVNPSGLSVGTHNATITVTAPLASNSPRTVVVTLNVTPAPELEVSPASLQFSYQIGGSNPAGQSLTIGGTAVTSFTASANSSGWLSVTPDSGSVPGSVTVNVNPNGLTANTHNGTVTISAPGATPVVVNVTFLVTDTPVISALPSELIFNYQIGGSVPAAQQLNIGGTAGLGYSLSEDADWLELSPAGGTTPGSVSVSVNPALLAAGTHTATITVTSAGASNSPRMVAVTLNVTEPPSLNVSPEGLSFSYQQGGALPTGQTLAITGTSVSSFTAVAAGGSWLSVTPGSGAVPGSVTVNVNPSGLTPNTYNGTVTISAPGATSKVVNVEFVVSPPPTISAAPETLSFTYQIGSNVPAAQQVDIGGTAGLVYTLADDAPWLNLSLSGGTTPGTVVASVDPTGLTVGAYNATITVSSVGATNSPQTVEVTLNVTPKPVLNVAPTSLSFSYQLGGSNPAAQNLNITGTNVSSFTAAASGGSWLSVTPGSGSAPGSVSVSVDPSGLAENTYNGTITISAAGADDVVVPVSLVVSNAILSVTPESLTFAYQIGGSVPAAQQVSIGGTAGIAYTVSDDAAWLNLSSAGGTTPGSVSASINPAGLTPGTYNATITVASNQAGNSPRTVAVTLNVTQEAKLNVSPTSLSFSYQIGGSQPAGQTLNITGTNVSSFTAAASGGAWLSVTPNNGSLPGSVTVNANPSGLAAGTYNGTVTISGPDATPVTINVVLLVTQGPTISANPGTITFHYEEGGELPPPQDIVIGGTSGIHFTFSDNAPWLTLSSSGNTTPGVVKATADPGTLEPGTYSATISIVAEGATNSPQSVAVVLQIDPVPSIEASPKTLSFNYQTGGAKPLAQTLNVSGARVDNFTASVSGGGWLSIHPSSGAVPGSVLVSVNPDGLEPGTYNASVTFSAANAPPAIVPVTLLVTSGPTISANPSMLQFSYRSGGALPAAQNLSITGTPSLAFTLTGDAPWLSLGNPGGEVPRDIAVSVNPQDLAPGTHTATILVWAPGAVNNPQEVEVTLDVAPPTLVDVSPSSLVFNHQAGSSNPPNQTLQLSGGTGPFTATASGGAWLSVTPASGTLPGSVIVSVNASGLAVGTYQGTIAISISGTPALNVPVTLNVSDNPQISTSSTKLTFTMEAGGTTPAPQTLTIGGTNGLAYSLAPGNAAWLTVSPVVGTVPGSATVSVNPEGLAPGTYSSAITIDAPGASNSGLTVDVELVISKQDPFISSVSSFVAIDYPGNAPGQIVFIQGQNMGPDAAVYFGVNQEGKISNTLANTRVYLNDVPAIPLMAYDTQVIAILPFSAPTEGTAQLQVEYEGRKSEPFAIPMSPAQIRLFTAEGTGKGPALALNPDGTLNSASNPAPKGSYIALYATGGGRLNPPVTAGDIAGSTLSTVVTQPVSATLNGSPAEVLYLGSAPTLANGVYQINLKLPEDASGILPVQVKVGDSTSQPNVTIYVQ